MTEAKALPGQWELQDHLVLGDLGVLTEAKAQPGQLELQAQLVLVVHEV